METLDKTIELLIRFLIWIAGFFVVAMILLTCANIVMRLVWVPVRGTFELMGYCGAIVTAFALAYTQLKRGHVAVDILVMRFSKKVQRVLNSINYFVCMVFFAIVAWQIAKYGTILLRTGEVTETLRIVYYPFAYGVALGCGALALVFLSDFLKSLMEETEGEK